MGLSNKIEDITAILRENAESNRSMSEEMHKIRIAQENMTNPHKSSDNKAFEGIKPPVNDDMEKAMAQNEQVRKRLKGDTETQEQRALREEKEYKANLLKAQTTTNQYLKTLTALQEMAKKPQTDTLMGQIGAMYSGTADYLKDSRFKTMQGLGGIMQTSRKVVSGIKKIPEMKSMWEDYRDKKVMDKSQNEVKKQQAILAAKEHKLRTKKDLSDKDREKLLAQISEARQSADTASEKYSERFARQYMKLKKKTDKHYRGLDKEDTEDLQSHIKDNLFERMKTETSFLQRSKSQLVTKSPTESNVIAKYLGMGNISSGVGYGKSPPSIDDGQGLSFKQLEKENSLDRARTQRLLDLMFGRKLNDNGSPKTYGEYIAGIYRQMKQSNETLDKLSRDLKNLQVGSTEDTGGGLFSMIGSMLGPMLGRALSGLGGMVVRGVASAVPAIASAALPALGIMGSAGAGLFIGDKIADWTGAKEGSTGIMSGFEGLVSGDGFLEGMQKGTDEGAQKKESARLIQSQTEAFNKSLKGGPHHMSMIGIPPNVLGSMTDAEKSAIFDAWMSANILNKTPASAYKSKKSSIISSVQKRIGESDKKTETTDAQSQNSAPATNVPKSTNTGANAVQPTMQVHSTMANVSGSIGKDQLNAMQMQAKLIATEMMLMQQNPKYIEQQNKFAKESGNSFAGSMFGG